MKAAFFHDHRFRRDPAGKHFSIGGLPYSVLSRYLSHFDDLVVVGRAQPVVDGARERLTVASGDHVEFACIPEASRLRLMLGSVVRDHVRSVLSSVDCAVIRVPSMIGAIAAREATRMKKPWMAEVVACVWDALWNYGALTGKLSAPWLYLENRRRIAAAPYAVYVSDRFLQRRYPCAGRTIGCSDVVVRPAPGEVLEARWSRIARVNRSDTLRLGMVGSLDHDYKGHETAIRAVALLAPKFPDLRLLCLGAGDPAKWKRLADELGVPGMVQFCGTLPSGGPVLEWMDALDVYLIPSLQEGLPRALVEAMSRGLPAVGARTGGIPELVEEHLTHRRRNHHELAARIELLIDDSAEMERCARRNIEVAREYEAERLDARRNEFMQEFTTFVRRATAEQRA